MVHIIHVARVLYTSKRNWRGGFVAEGVGSTVLAVISGGGISSVRGRIRKKRVKNRLLGHGVTMLARVKPHLEVWGSEKGGLLTYVQCMYNTYKRYFSHFKGSTCTTYIHT